MRRLVAEGRKKEFAAFGFGEDIPDPEDQKTYEMSKLNWNEQSEGKHAEMLAWVKALIKLRRSRVCFNDGDMHHLLITRDDERQTLTMARDEARILVNFGKENVTFALLDGEEVSIVSRDGLEVQKNRMELPPMTLAVLLSTSEDAEDRQVASRQRTV